MEKMFCFQCEQTAKGTGCTVQGVCGKNPVVAYEQDEITLALIELAVRIKGQTRKPSTDRYILDGLFTCITNVSFDDELCAKIAAEIRTEAAGYEPTNGAVNIAVHETDDIFHGDKNQVSLRSLLLFGLRGMGAYAYHAYVLGYTDDKMMDDMVRYLAALAEEHSVEEWLQLLHDFGMSNYHCMELLDRANTESFGNPRPTSVTMKVEKGPFIVVSGHDFHDLTQLLDQTEGKGINIYTHGEMLPAHGYPELTKHKHLKGNFGTAWQNQQKEFADVPAAFLFTTNCLMPPRKSYMDRVFTTAVVEYPGLVHIDGDEKDMKDFTAVIDKALELGGWDEDKYFTGINGGGELMTGFGHNAVLSQADVVVEAVKSGLVNHFYLIGGCDGAKPGRNYYTDLAKNTGDDSLILTVACGKYRFNDLDLGHIGPFPRIMDMGQCNDAYSAIRVATALADAFETDINSIPLTIVLSWYEQKAVCVLLSLLALGVKNIKLGPTLPAFVSPDVLTVLNEQFGLTPISTVEVDLAR